MTVKISTTSCDILDTGTVIVPNSEYIDFNIENLYFRVIFEEEVKNPENGELLKPKYELEPLPNKEGVIIKMQNIKDALENATNTNMTTLATVKGRDLSLRFCITPINKRDNIYDYLFSYTWYLSKQ